MNTTQTFTPSIIAQFVSLLNTGEVNAVPISVLASRLGLTGSAGVKDTTVRALARAARLRGFLVGSRPRTAGFYLMTDTREVAAVVRSLRSRAAKINQVADAMAGGVA